MIHRAEQQLGRLTRAAVYFALVLAAGCAGMDPAPQEPSKAEVTQGKAPASAPQPPEVKPEKPVAAKPVQVAPKPEAPIVAKPEAPAAKPAAKTAAAPTPKEPAPK